jgi:osmotically-inducible protein OsmY
MKIKKIIILISLVFVTGCVGYSSTGVLGTGVSIALDPRSLGTQIDDSIMQQNLRARLITADKSYIISVKTKILDGRIFLTGKVNSVEDKLKITKLAWEIKGARSVNNDLQIKEKFDFKRSAKDLLITSQLRAAIIGNKKIKSVNYNIDTYKKIIYVYGIAQNKIERDEVTKEAKQILDVEDVITSIFLVDDLRVVKK